jgi:hypothetical protein
VLKSDQYFDLAIIRGDREVISTVPHFKQQQQQQLATETQQQNQF